VKNLQRRSGYRLRLGQYRVWFHAEGNETETLIVIDRVLPGGDAYE